MSFPSSTKVLVVGAGPVGMACALSLWFSGVKDVVIVDTVEQGNNTSRAVVIHAATLEALDIIGCADAVVGRGVKVSAMDYYDRSDTLLMGVDFGGLIGKTRFPFYILLPQHVTEDILSQRLKDVGIRGAGVCLIGDAAHIHPPAGGQGMNLGLRDATSLGPVIAAALAAGPSPETDEKVRAHMALRRERAVKVIGMTKVISAAFRAKFSWSLIHIYTIRDWVFWLLSKSS